jgi:hypothetical protein
VGLQIGVLLVERFRHGVQLSSGKWIAIAGIVLLQAYLVLAPNETSAATLSRERRGASATMSGKFGEDDGGVGESSRLECSFVGDHRPHVLDDVPDVDVHGCGDDAVANSTSAPRAGAGRSAGATRHRELRLDVSTEAPGLSSDCSPPAARCRAY